MRKNTYLLLVTLLLTAAGISRAQQMDRDTVLMPYPEIGWEKFDSLIVYPEISRRAGIEGYYGVQIEVDTLGNASVIKDDSQKNGGSPLLLAIEEAIKKVKWEPAKLNDKSINFKIEIPVFYYIKYKYRAPLIIKETDKPVIRKEVQLHKR